MYHYEWISKTIKFEKKNQGPGYGQDGNTYITFENMQNKATYYLWINIWAVTLKHAQDG